MQTHFLLELYKNELSNLNNTGHKIKSFKELKQ